MVENASVVGDINRGVGNQVVYSCNDGYKHASGDTTITCQEDELWSSINLICLG